MGALETVNTTLQWLLLCMGKHPTVQCRLQAEIDAQIGTTRQPELSDRPCTPYVDAVIEELFRFSSLAPLGILHIALEDAELCGYKILENTLLISNIYGLHHDPEVWNDPEFFRPERFLNENGKLNKSLLATMLPFSTGKRSCPGESLARDQVYLYTTSLFQKFSVHCSEDVRMESTTAGITRAPKPFKVTFTKRFYE